MKELSIKEKAKAYDEALKLIKECTPDENGFITIYPNEIFPELKESKESDDEKIRKALLRFHKSTIDIDGIKGEDILAWLEKHKYTEDDLDKAYKCADEVQYRRGYEDAKKEIEKQGKNNMGISEATKQKLEDNLNKALEKETPESWNEFLEKQGEQKPYGQRQECVDCQFNYAGECKGSCAMKRGEQKPDDKVEPKFHEGEWVVTDKNNVVQIKAIEDSKYVLENTMRFSVDYVDKCWRKWTIQDAKDGDVLSDGTTIFIFKDLLSDGSVMSYCDYDTDSGESDAFCPLSVNLMCSKITPSTKEQRDTLEKAMSDAGYTFDFEKKELKKIEQSPAWSEEDIELLDNTIKFIEDRVAATSPSLRTYSPTLTGKEIPFLKALKDRVQPKQEWSEEDRKIIIELIGIFESAIDGGHVAFPYRLIKDYIRVLKSFLPQNTWKPSERQKEALLWCVVHLGGADKQTLGELLEELNKL